jgi:hypothetical protein
MIKTFPLRVTLALGSRVADRILVRSMHLIRLAAVSVALLACSAAARSERAPHALDVIITEHSVRVDGVELRSGPRTGNAHYLSLTAARKVLGPPQDTYVAGLGVTVFAWSDAGIHLQRGFRGSDEGKIIKFQVWLQDTADQEHKQAGQFRGHVHVEGVDITPDSSFETVQPALEKAGFQITRYPYVIEAAKGQIKIFTVDTTDKLERVEAWCP